MTTLPRPGPLDTLDGPGTELDLLWDQMADVVEATEDQLATHTASTAAHGISAFGATLVDDSSASAARTTLGLGGAAILSVGTTSGTVAAGDDARLAAETAATIGSLVAGATAKTSPVDADTLGLADSAASNVLKKFSWANLKSALQSVFATLAGITGGQTMIGGAAASENLTLQSTSHATRGDVLIGGFARIKEALARIGFGVTSPTARVHIQAGTATASTAPLKIDAGTLLTVVEAGTIERTTDHLYVTNTTTVGRCRVATEQETFGGVAGYPNGSGELRSNAGYATLAFDQEYTDSAVGAFLVPLTANGIYFGDYFPINRGLFYRVSCSVGAGEYDGSTWDAANRHYFGLAFFDRRKQQISRYMSQVVVGTVTTLAVQLDIGSTTLTLTSAANWSIATSQRHFAWQYTDPEGCIYPAGGYSRNVSKTISGFGTEAWSTSGISGNIITLVAPWPGPVIPAGAPIWNSSDSGGTYVYCFMNYSQAPLGWTRFESVIGPYQYPLERLTETIPLGAAFARFVFLCNYHGVADTRIRLKGLSITNVSPGNLPTAVGFGSTYRSKAVLELPTNGVAVEGRIGSGVVLPATQIHAISTTEQLRLGYDAAQYVGFTVSAAGSLVVSPTGARTGLQGSIEIVASSSTTANQIQGALSASWVDNTHATRKARLVINAYDTTAREAIRVEGSGTAPLIGFYGSAAVAKPTALTATVAAAPAGGTGTAAGAWDTAGNRDLAIATINNLKTRVDQLESKLQALGLLT